MNIIKGVPPKVSVTSDVAVDLEVFGQTDGKLHRPTGHFASMQIAIGEDVYIVLDEKDVQKAWDNIKHAKNIIFFNAMYDIRQIRRWAKIEQRPIYDVMLVEADLWGGYYDVHISLADVCRRYLDIHLEKGTRKEFSTMTVMTDDMLEYSAKDAYYTLKAKQAQDREVEARGYDLRTYWELDEPSLWCALEFQPMKVDSKRWLTMTTEFAERGMKMQDELGVNVYSAPQVKKAILKNCKVALDSTGAAELKEIGGEYIEKILLIRQLRKAASTYGPKWLEKYVEGDGLVYTDFYINGTDTGRFSSSNPNLLNIPARKIPEYRELFVSKYGKMIVADISQQEPRILAALSGDEKLLEIFKTGQDIHLMVTRAAFNDDSITKTDPRRDVGKMINLATSYGMTAVGLAKKINISEEEASRFLNSYFARFPKVYEYKQRQQEFANRFGYVESITGRRIWVNAHNFQWANNSINAPIQGCIEGSAMIITKEYGAVPIQDVLQHKFIHVWDGYEFVEAQVAFSGMKQKVNITFEDERKIVCSPDHKFLTRLTNHSKNWKSAINLRPMDMIMHSKSTSDFNTDFVLFESEKHTHWKAPNGVATTKDVSFENLSKINPFGFGVVLGRLQSDGHINDRNVRLLVAEHEYDILPELYNYLDFIGKYRVHSYHMINQDMTEIDFDSVQLARQLIHYDIKNDFPRFVWGNKEIMRGFLRGMFDGDGTVNKDNIILTFGQGRKFETYARHVQIALSMFGIISRLHFCEGRINVSIQKKHVKRFARNIGFMSKTKQYKAENVSCCNASTYGDVCRIKTITITDEVVPMYDVINSDSGRFCANGLVVHNSAADFTKLWLIKLLTKCREGGIIYPVCNVVYDEIVADSPNELVNTYKDLIAVSFDETAKELFPSIPFEIDMHVGKNWSCKKLEKEEE